MTPRLLLDPLALISSKESDNRYNVFYGGAIIPPNVMTDRYGFPLWSGLNGSHAAGAYQFEPATWAHYASRLGITDFSPKSQDAVAAACWAMEGFAPWAPYDKRLADAIALRGGIGAFSIGASWLAK